MKFQERFKTEDDCIEFIYGVVSSGSCLHCDHKMYRVRGRKCWSCGSCGKQFHPLANTIFSKSRTPLREWFYVIFMFSVTKTGVSAKEIQRTLGVTYKSAFRMGHLVRSIMNYNLDKIDDMPHLVSQFTKSIEATHNQISVKYFDSYMKEFIYRYQNRYDDIVSTMLQGLTFND